MAKTRRVGMAERPGSRRGAPRQRGGTMLGFLVGLVVGLGIAVVVALFVTRAPVPFMNKGNRAPERIGETRDGAQMPDPNAPLQKPREAAGGGSAPAPAPTQAPAVATPAPAAPAAPSAPAASAQPPSQERSESGYLLQAGAFRSSADAESMRGRLALLGFEARVVAAEVNGTPMFRVRIGPFAQQEEANRARSRLADGGIEASVIRQR